MAISVCRAVTTLGTVGNTVKARLKTSLHRLPTNYNAWSGHAQHAGGPVFVWGDMDIIELSITNWSRYNPRKEFIKPRWFAMSNTMLEQAFFYKFTSDEIRAWLYVLSQASKENSSRVSIDPEHAERVCRVPATELYSALSKLEKDQCIQIHVRGAVVDVRRTASTGDYKVLQGNQEGANAPSPATAKKAAPGKRETHSMVAGEDFNSLLKEYIADWVSLYDQEYVKREVLKSLMWLKANPRKNKKTIRGWVQFYSGWLDRNWDKATTKGPSQKVAGDGWDEKAALVKSTLAAHGSSAADQSEIARKLGPELHQLVLKIGTYRIRELREDGFYIRNVAGMLKNANANLGGK